MKASSPRRPVLVVAALAALVSVVLAWSAAPLPAGGGGGCGHDARLDLAMDNLDKAFALIAAAQNEGVEPPFGGNDTAALAAIRVARGKVLDAIAYAENSCD